MDSLLITIIEKPDESLLKKINIFSKENWGEHDESATELRNNYFDTPNIVVIASLNDEIIGIQLVFLRKITYKDVEIKLAGLGGLVVHKDLRHKGIASILLKATLKNLASKNIDVAMLCTDIEVLGHLYRRVGFIPLGRSYYFFDKNGKEKLESGGMIAVVNNKSVFDLILNTQDSLVVGSSNF